MARRARQDVDWREILTDPGYERLLQAIHEFSNLDYSDGPTAAAVVYFLDDLVTTLAEEADSTAEELARRNFSTRVSAAMRGAANDLGASADYYRKAGKALREDHSALFELRVSKPVEPIGA